MTSNILWLFEIIIHDNFELDLTVVHVDDTSTTGVPLCFCGHFNPCQERNRILKLRFLLGHPITAFRAIFVPRIARNSELSGHHRRWVIVWRPWPSNSLKEIAKMIKHIQNEITRHHYTMRRNFGQQFMMSLKITLLLNEQLRIIEILVSDHWQEWKCYFDGAVRSYRITVVTHD